MKPGFKHRSNLEISSFHLSRDVYKDFRDHPIHPFILHVGKILRVKGQFLIPDSLRVVRTWMPLFSDEDT